MPRQCGSVADRGSVPIGFARAKSFHLLFDRPPQRTNASSPRRTQPDRHQSRETNDRVMITGQPYQDRREAGQILAAHVREYYDGTNDAIVLALPRGGVPIGFEVA